MISKEELAEGIARTQADMDAAKREPEFRAELAAIKARYAELESREREADELYRYLMSQRGWLPSDYSFDRAEANDDTTKECIHAKGGAL